MTELKKILDLFIKNKYITRKTNEIMIRIDGGSLSEMTDCNVKIKPYYKPMFGFSLTTILPNRNLLKFPVKKIIIWKKESYDNPNKKKLALELKNIDESSIIKTIKVMLRSNVKEIDRKFTICFNCISLPETYTDSFLYNLDVLNPELYMVLKKHKNTIILNRKYEAALCYISNNIDDVKKKYDIDTSIENTHYILEEVFNKIFDKAFNLKDTNHRIIIRNDNLHGMQNDAVNKVVIIQII